MPVKKTLGNVLISGLCVATVNSFAAMDSEVTLGTSGRWTDNVFFDSTERRNDVLGEATLSITLQSLEEAYDAALNYQFIHDNYLRDSFGNENYIQGSGDLNIHLLPNRLFWQSNIQSEITRRDSVGVDVPANRDQRNFAETGLRYLMLGGGRDQVSIAPSVSATRFREADFNNNNRGTLDVRWSHSLNSVTDTGFNCEGEKVDFTEAAGDYDTARCNISFTRRLPNGAFNLDAGKRKINPAIGDTLDGVAYTLGWNWADAQHSFNVLAVRDLQDNTQSLGGADFIGGDGPIEVNTDLRSLSVRKRFEVQYAYVLSRTDQLALTGYLDSDDVYQSNLDTDRTGADLTYTRTLRPRLDGRIRYSFVKSEFAASTDSETIDYDDFVRIELNKTFSRQFQAFCGLEAEVRRAQLDVQDYEAYSAEIGFTYTFD